MIIKKISCREGGEGRGRKDKRGRKRIKGGEEGNRNRVREGSRGE